MMKIIRNSRGMKDCNFSTSTLTVVVYLPHPSTPTSALCSVPCLQDVSRQGSSSPPPRVQNLNSSNLTFFHIFHCPQKHFDPFSFGREPTPLYIHSFSIGKNFLKHTKRTSSSFRPNLHETTQHKTNNTKPLQSHYLPIKTSTMTEGQGLRAKIKRRFSMKDKNGNFLLMNLLLIIPTPLTPRQSRPRGLLRRRRRDFLSFAEGDRTCRKGRP